MKVTLKTKTGLWHIDIDAQEFEKELKKCIEDGHPESINLVMYDLFDKRYPSVVDDYFDNSSITDLFYEDKKWEVGKCVPFLKSLIRNEKLNNILD